MRKIKWLLALIPIMAFALASDMSEMVVSAEVVHEANGYAVKIGDQTIPIRAYEMPVCLAGGGQVKLALKLEGNPPKVVEAAVVEGPCPKGAKFEGGFKEQLSALVQKGYLEGQGEIVREQGRWMLRVGDTMVPIDQELPACLRQEGATVQVRTFAGDSGELTVEKGDCVTQVRLSKEEKTALQMQLKTQMQLESKAKKGNSAMTMPEDANTAMKGTAKGVKETAKETQETINQAKEKVEEHMKTPNTNSN